MAHFRPTLAVLQMIVTLLTPFSKRFLIYIYIYIYIIIYFDSHKDKAETSTYFDGIQSNLLSEFSTNIDTRCVFDVCDVVKNFDKLEIGKACGLDDITKEFVMYSHPAIVAHLQMLLI